MIRTEDNWKIVSLISVGRKNLSIENIDIQIKSFRPMAKNLRFFSIN